MKTILFIFLSLAAQGLWAENCNSGFHWVRAHHRNAYYRADGTFVSAANVSAHCQKNSDAYDFWAVKLKSERPIGWPNENEKLVPWSLAETEQVIDALSALPKSIWGNYIKGIYRMDKSKDDPNPASSGGGFIVLYNRAFGSAKRPGLARVLAHELAHEVYRHLNDLDKTAYNFSTSWLDLKTRKEPVWSNRRNSNEFIRPEGQLGPDEDFAECLEAFLFDPGLLKRRVPYAYVWMKRHFGDKFKLISKGSDK